MKHKYIWSLIIALGLGNVFGAAKSKSGDLDAHTQMTKIRKTVGSEQAAGLLKDFLRANPGFDYESEYKDAFNAFLADTKPTAAAEKAKMIEFGQQILRGTGTYIALAETLFGLETKDFINVVTNCYSFKDGLEDDLKDGFFKTPLGISLVLGRALRRFDPPITPAYIGNYFSFRKYFKYLADNDKMPEDERRFFYAYFGVSLAKKVDADRWAFYHHMVPLEGVIKLWQEKNKPVADGLIKGLTETEVAKESARKEIKPSGYPIKLLTIAQNAEIAKLSYSQPKYYGAKVGETNDSHKVLMQVAVAKELKATATSGNLEEFKKAFVNTTFYFPERISSASILCVPNETPISEMVLINEISATIEEHVHRIADRCSEVAKKADEEAKKAAEEEKRRLEREKLEEQEEEEQREASARKAAELLEKQKLEREELEKHMTTLITPFKGGMLDDAKVTAIKQLILFIKDNKRITVDPSLMDEKKVKDKAYIFNSDSKLTKLGNALDKFIKDIRKLYPTPATE